MKNRQTLYFITSLLLLSGIFITVAFYFQKKYMKELTSSKNSYNIANNTLIATLLDANKNLEYKIYDLTLIDTLNNKTRLTNLINGKNILIYRVAYTHCSSCVTSGLNSLTATSTIPYDNIVIIGSFYNNNDLKEFTQKNRIKFKIFNVKQNIDLPAEQFGVPYFIVLSKDLKVISCFFPEKANSIYTDYFLSGIKHFFIEK